MHDSELVFKENFSPTNVFNKLGDITDSLERDAIAVGSDVVNQLNDIGIDSKPCHQDLYCGNFVIYKDQTFLFDWEYSSMGDPYFDYADLFWQNEFDKDVIVRQKSLSEININSSEQVNKFQLFEIMSMITWGLWARRKSYEGSKYGDDALIKAINLGSK